MQKTAIIIILILMLNTIILILPNSTVTAFSWYDSDWQYCKKITINSTKVEATLTNFPVLISITDTDLRDKARNDGYDILFTNSDNTIKYNHEIERWNKTTGELIAWVNVTHLSASVDTVLWMYYGNNDTANQQNITGTWDSNYVMVQHMNDATTSTISDSTSYGYDGTKYAANNPLQIEGKIGYGQEFDGNTAKIYTTSGVLTDQTAFTVSVWFLAEMQTDSYPRLVDYGWPVNAFMFNYGRNINDNILDLTTANATNNHRVVSKYIPYDNSSVYHAVGVWESNTTFRLYINGILESNNDAFSHSFTLKDARVVIGSVTTTTAYIGMIDEVRISNIARNCSWIKTKYNNQVAPENFMSVGSEFHKYGYITVSAITPNNQTVPINNILLQATIQHSLGGPMNLTWSWNNSGVWTELANLTGVYNGTYGYYTTGAFNFINTNYTWRLVVNGSSTGVYIIEYNQSYPFTTGYGEIEVSEMEIQLEINQLNIIILIGLMMFFIIAGYASKNTKTSACLLIFAGLFTILAMLSTTAYFGGIWYLSSPVFILISIVFFKDAYLKLTS